MCEDAGSFRPCGRGAARRYMWERPSIRAPPVSLSVVSRKMAPPKLPSTAGSSSTLDVCPSTGTGARKVPTVDRRERHDSQLADLALFVWRHYSRRPMLALMWLWSVPWSSSGGWCIEGGGDDNLELNCDLGVGSLGMPPVSVGAVRGAGAGAWMEDDDQCQGGEGRPSPQHWKQFEFSGKGEFPGDCLCPLAC
jgi:hypothetical protein